MLYNVGVLYSDHPEDVTLMKTPKTRSLNVRMDDQDFDYLAEQVDEEAPSLSAVLRLAISKARAFDDAVREGRLPTYELTEQQLDDVARDSAEAAHRLA